jgi:hypothetical protein
LALPLIPKVHFLLINLTVIRKEVTDPHVSPCIKTINSKWIKGLNVRPETLKLLEANIRKTDQDVGRGNDFLNRTPITWETIARLDKQDNIKLSSLQQRKQ